MSAVLGRPDSPRRPAVLVLPGLHGSGPRHWQSVWERRHREFQRVVQASWSEPRLGDWAAMLERAVRTAPAPVVLVAHSLACALVAHWARAGTTARVAAALLVAPADVDAMGDVELRSFAPMPLERLPFPSWVVASENDPFVALDRARSFARAWGARFLEAGRCGHINVASGHGPWPEGEALLAELAAPRWSLSAAPARARAPWSLTSPRPRAEVLGVFPRSTPRLRLRWAGEEIDREDPDRR